MQDSIAARRRSHVHSLDVGDNGSGQHSSDQVHDKFHKGAMIIALAVLVGCHPVSIEHAALLV